MKISTVVPAILLISLVLTGSLQAQTFAKLSVSAHMDIWQAGGYSDGSDGVPPAAYTFPAAAGQLLRFVKVAGSWTCSGGVPAYGPDGTTGACDNPGEAQHINPIGPFSGYNTTDFTGALAGMFLENSLPVSTPPSLTFYDSDSSGGGIQTDFFALRPLIGQVFFIGDGSTGTGTGLVQVFAVPPTATHLYLGFVDACSGGGGAPGCYFDNEGSVTAILLLHTIPLLEGVN